MKLLYCGNCDDIFNLAKIDKWCHCGISGGMYLADEYCAIYTGNKKTIPLGFANSSFAEARWHKFLPGAEWGEEFKAWVMSPGYWRFKKVRRSELHKNWRPDNAKQEIKKSRKKRCNYETID